MIIDITINVINTVINIGIMIILLIYNNIDNIVNIIYVSACMSGPVEK